MSPLQWIDQELSNLKDRGLLRCLNHRDSSQAVRLTINSQELINFSSNDYLALAADRRLTEAVQQATDDEAWGSGASPLINGRSLTHVALEKKLAQFEAAQSAILFSSGYAANVGTIAALVGSDDVIYSDEKNHASIVDGCRLSRANVVIYPHADYNALSIMLKKSGRDGRRLIVTDSLFSMDGDFAPLVELADLANQYDAMLMVDEAHATGIYGETGRGVAQQLGIEQQVDIRVGTLSKALGCAGGFVCGSNNLIRWLANRARSYVFSTAHPAATYAAGLAAIDIIEQEPQRREILLNRAAQLREQLIDEGWQIGKSCSQIIPVSIGHSEKTMQMAQRLREKSVLVPGIRPPSVAEGDSLLRISLSYAHTESMIQKLVQSLSEVREGLE